MRLRVVNREETGNVLTLGAEIEVLEPTLFSYLVYYKAPYTGGGNTLLPPGEKLIVSSLPKVRLVKDGKRIQLRGHYAYFHFKNPAQEALYIDPVVHFQEKFKDEMRAIYNGYSLYIEAEVERIEQYI